MFVQLWKHLLAGVHVQIESSLQNPFCQLGRKHCIITRSFLFCSVSECIQQLQVSSCQHPVCLCIGGEKLSLPCACLSRVRSAKHSLTGQETLSISKAPCLKVMFEGNNAQFLWEKCVNEGLALLAGISCLLFKVCGHGTGQKTLSQTQTYFLHHLTSALHFCPAHSLSGGFHQHSGACLRTGFSLPENVTISE